jgi:plastocyanin
MTQRIRFAPDTVRIGVGEVVEWRNVSTGIGHTATLLPESAADAGDARLPAGARPFDSGNVPPGGSWRHRFDVPGTYVYYCTPHVTVGMVGVIVVSG